MHSDVICDYPLKDMLAFHEARNAEATILVTKVRRGVWERGGCMKAAEFG